MTSSHALNSRRAADAAFLVATVGLSAACYARGLGFYSDDWALLSHMALAADESFASAFRALSNPWVAMRPVQIAYFAILYKAFGLAPLGYHLVNAVVLASTAVLLHELLRELGVPRRLGLAVALIYTLFPGYSAVRFWFAAFGHLLSMALCLMAAYAMLRARRTADWGAWVGWLLGAAVALVASGLSYEVPLPFLAVAIGVSLVGPGTARPRTRRDLAAAALLGAVLSAVVVFKSVTTTRLDGDVADLWSQIGAIVVRALHTDPAPDSSGLDLWLAVQTHFGGYGAILATAFETLRAPADHIVAVGTGLCVALGVAVVLVRIRPTPDPAGDWTRWLARLFWWGWAMFWLGYAIFLTNSSVQFSLTGVANRANIGAALGAAMIFVAATGAVCRVLTNRPTLFAILIALQAGAFTTMAGRVAEHWRRAWSTADTILARVVPIARQLPEGATLLLDGVCPYDGPAIVFESNWDLAGALRLRLDRRALSAGVATKVTVDAGGLSTRLYGRHYLYAFGDGLFIYDLPGDRLTPIPDRRTALAYLSNRRFRPGTDCPPGAEGHGAPLR